MNTQRFISALLVGSIFTTTSVSAYAQDSALLQALAAADPQSASIAIDPDKVEVPAASRLLKPLLTKIAATGAFDTADGQAKLFEAITRAVAYVHDTSMKNLDRLSDPD